MNDKTKKEIVAESEPHTLEEVVEKAKEKQKGEEHER